MKRVMTPLLALAALFSACEDAPHPIPDASLSPADAFISVTTIEGRKGLKLVDQRGARALPWDHALQKGESTSWGGERLFGLGSDVVYCGEAFVPDAKFSCWQIGTEQTVERDLGVTPPGLPPKEGIKHVGVARNGSWWAYRGDSLEFAPSFEAPLEAVESDFSELRKVDYNPSTDRFLVLERKDAQCRLVVVERVKGRRLASTPLESCHTTPIWSADGETAYFALNEVLWTWRGKEEPKAISTRTKGPDGRDEMLHLMATSPSGDSVLVRSTRYARMHHNVCADVYNPVFETFIIEPASGKWTRLPDLGSLTVWTQLR